MSQDNPVDVDQALRLHIYRFWCEQGRPPTVAENARACGLSDAAALAAWGRLHDVHLILLEADGTRIRMANPLSALPTDFRVRVGRHWLFANCAWDAPGIPAMLQQDVVIEARCSPRGERLRFSVRAGELQAEEALVHFALPFRHWYDDLVET